MRKSKFNPDRELERAAELTDLSITERRMLRASIMLSAPDGSPATVEEILQIVGKAIELAEENGWDASDFVHFARARVFKKKRRRKAKRPSYKEPPLVFRNIELDSDDAAVVLRSDGVSELYEPEDPLYSKETRRSAWKASALAHFANDPTLSGELTRRFQQYTRDHFGTEH